MTNLLVLFLVAGLIWAWVYSLSIKVERLTIPIRGLPTEFAGFTIVHFSDLHGRAMPMDGEVFAIIKACKPDLCAVTGDFVSHSVGEMKYYLPFLAALASFVPVYAVSGNHDHAVGWDEVTGRLQGAGVNVLNDQHSTITRGGAELVVVGVRDPFSGRGKLDKAMPPPSSATLILLSHSPSYFEAYARHGRFVEERRLLARVALTLCGHTHGGQIKLPLVGALTNGSKRLFPREYVEGLSREGDNWLYITRGLGWGIIPVRFLSRPEVTIITLQSISGGQSESKSDQRLSQSQSRLQRKI